MYQASQISTKNLLAKEKFSEKIINQLANVSTLANYGQDINVNGFVGLVSLAAISTELWCVKTGNKQVPIRLLKNNKSANVIFNATVKSINPKNDKNLIEYEINNRIHSKTYDYVIIACPLTKNNEINLGFDYIDHLNYELHFNQACLIEGTINLFPNIPKRHRIEMFSCDPTTDCRIICTQLPCDFSEERDASLILNNERNIFKTFSPYDLTDQMTERIFEPDYKLLKKCNWLGFPKYETIKKQAYPGIHVDSQDRSRVFYLNSIEWAASCMELSCISARNIALLISIKEIGKLATETKCRHRFTGFLNKEENSKYIFCTIIIITFIISIFSSLFCILAT